jgi:hypothetical protein
LYKEKVFKKKEIDCVEKKRKQEKGRKKVRQRGGIK